MIGESLGSYRVLRVLGQGGMGMVLLAEHPLIGKKAAVKVLLPHFSVNQEIVQRFFNEARATTMLRHPNVVDIYDFGFHASGSAYIVMEFLEGESLAARLARSGRLATAEIVAIGRQIAGALEAAHQRGIVHRDLKPDNVFLVPDESAPAGVRVKILDFGIAKLADEASGSVKTLTGAVMGTPSYMSPEQCRGAGMVDPRSDVYALGCVLFHLASGRPPFGGEGPGDVMAAHIHVAAPDLAAAAPGTAPGLVDLVRRSLAKAPDERPRRMSDVAAALAAIDDRAAPGPARLTPYGGFAPATPPITTLSGAAGARPHTVAAPRRRLALVLALALAAAVAGVVAAVVIPGLAKPPVEEVAAAAPAPVAALPVTAPPAPPVAVPAPLPPPDAAPPAPSKVRLEIVSAPAGATLYRVSDGIKLGRAPLLLELLPAGGELEVIAKLSGYRDARGALAADRDGTLSLKLSRDCRPATKSKNPLLVNSIDGRSGAPCPP